MAKNNQTEKLDRSIRIRAQDAERASELLKHNL